MIPAQFEFIEDDIIKFVRVVEKFTDLNDGLMYRVVVRWDNWNIVRQECQCKVVTEEEILEMLKTRADM